MQKAFDGLNSMANRVSGDHTRKSMALQAILVLLVVRTTEPSQLNGKLRAECHIFGLQVLRVAYALWAVVHLSLASLMWSLIVLSVLFLGLTATRNRQRFLLLIVHCFLLPPSREPQRVVLMSLFLRAYQYIAAMCVVMALTALGLFLVLLGEVLTLSVDLVEIIVDGCSLLFEVHATGLVLDSGSSWAVGDFQTQSRS